MAPRTPSPTHVALDKALARHESVIAAAVEAFGLPLHLIFKDEVEQSANGYKQVLGRLYPNSRVLFAVKSNPCRGAVRTAARLGLGADAASEHEFRVALEEGISAERIVANGNAKTSRYIEAIVSSGALSSVDNADEFEELSRTAAKRRVRVPVLVRFRGMPLSGFTADDQTTAAEWTKFGFPIDEADQVFEQVARSPGLRFAGISAHVGTQIADPVAYERLAVHMIALAQRVRASGQSLSAIDLGGGYPVSFVTQAEWVALQAELLERLRAPADCGESVTWTDFPMGYDGVAPDTDSPSWVGKAYWSAFPASAMLEHILTFRHPDGRTTAEHLADLGSPTLIVEPGRSLMATAGVTLAEVRGTKSVLGNPVVSLDLGITNHGTNLITNDIFPVAILPRKADDLPVDAFLAGRLCFSGDMISKVKVRLNRTPHPGERAVIYLTGAYCADHFASNSCGFPLPGKVAVDGASRLEVWRHPQTFEDVFGPVGAV
ncbi:MAG: hypothetical protein NTY63_04255 [Candidatus Bipolaricaulota bacterium]|nr:hypothetical protein [Candidatus Bipolaricaulota bacterium]